MSTRTLPSTRTSEAIRRKVIRAATLKFGRGKAQPFFEHGHWWVRVPDYYGDDGGATFDVVDAEPGIADTELDFEEI